MIDKEILEDLYITQKLNRTRNSYDTSNKEN